MKKLTTILLAFILFISASAFTKGIDDSVSEKIKTEFEKNFTTATYVSWQKTQGIYFAIFKIKDQNFTAAYNDDGEFLAASRVTSIAQLPLSVTLAMQNKYPNYIFDKSIVELTKDGETTYYMNAENAKFYFRFTSNSFGDLTITKKIRKK